MTSQFLSFLNWRRATALLAVAIFLGLFGLLSRPFENQFRDLLTATISPFTQPGEEIVIIGIDEQTLAKLAYRSPIDRKFLSSLLRQVGEARPRAVGIDVLFDRPTEAEKDHELQGILRNPRFPVVLASAEAADGLTEEQAAFLRGFAPDTPRGLAVLLRDATDGVVRQSFPGRQSGEKWQSGFASAVAAAGGAAPSQVGPDLVYYHDENGLPYTFPVYPAHAALLLPPHWFAGKFVLIGSVLPLDDRHRTPFALLDGVQAGTLPGVVIHAHALAQILNGSRIERIGPLPLTLLLLFGTFMSAWLAWRPTPILLKPLILMILVASMFSTSAWLFHRYALLVPAVWPSILFSGVFAIVGFFAWHRDNDERRQIRQAFNQYVSPEVVRQVLHDPGKLRLGGERRNITCIFTDLEGFTGLSEELLPEAIADLLNGYLNAICDCFIQHGATIDKIVGDSVVGFFGAPVAQDDQAEQAVRLALEIDHIADSLRRELAAKGKRLGTTRIGINSGPAVVGNFGGRRFFDYTAIGDTVNTAARLEGANKQLGTRICVSASTAGYAPGQQFRNAAVLHLKGKRRSIEAFEPLAPGDMKLTYRDAYQEAYELMAAKRPEAEEAFAILARKFADDSLIAFHCTRIASGNVTADVYLDSK